MAENTDNQAGQNGDGNGDSEKRNVSLYTEPKRNKNAVTKMSTDIDMTPMVDLAFLLITFFMLTVKFRPTESVEIVLPSSIDQTKVPATNLLKIQVSDDGRVFFGVDSKHTMERALVKLNEEREDLELSQAEISRAAAEPDIGVPFERLDDVIKMSSYQRSMNKDQFTGIPIDSTDNQLAFWISAARRSNPQLRIAVKADAQTPYPVIEKVVNTLKDKNINRFNLVTSNEPLPEGMVLKQEDE